MRHRRIDLTLAREKTLEIPAVFKQQSFGLVLRMSLEKDEETLSLLYERIHACRRPCENAITGRRQLRLRKIVPSRVGHAESQRQAVGQFMFGDGCAIENTEPLFAEPLTAHTVHAKYGGMRG